MKQLTAGTVKKAKGGATMRDLISREALVDKTEILYQHTESGKIIPWSAVRVCEINNIPTVDAEPVRHGRWEGIWGGGWKKPQIHCTICKKTIKYTDDFLHGFPNYCPNCGAKMDGGSNDGTEKD